MTPNTSWPTVEDGAAALVRAALERLDGTQHELVLDFSAVGRIGAPVIHDLERLAAKAREHSVEVHLRGVNVEVYKTLKLIALAGHFSFAS